MDATGVIFDIQRFAIHDGPGIRTTVFLKGCGLRCGWCHNPESFTMAPQLQYYPDRCAGCGLCAGVCPFHELSPTGHVISRVKCTGCGKCAGVCNTQALIISGKTMTADEVKKAVLEDKAYYTRSGGGMTLSGGEPVLQSGFALELLRAAKGEGIHTVLETSGSYPWELAAPLTGSVDLILFDLKAWDEGIYQKHIGSSREIILTNLKRFDETGVPLAVRTPVVGGVNDDETEIGKIAGFVSGLRHLSYYQLIPYHTLGKAKYDALGLSYNVPYATPSKERMAELEQVAAVYTPVYNPIRPKQKEELV